MADRLAALGAAVIEAPAIRIEHLDGPAPEPSDYDLICLTSPNGVEALFTPPARRRPGRAARFAGRGWR